MTHNTANTIGFIAYLAFIGFLMFYFSPWWIILFIFTASGFKTEKELENDRLKKNDKLNQI